MLTSSLNSTDKPLRLFPKGDKLYPLVAPTFNTIRQRLGGLCISTIWMDADMDPSRAGFRPSYDGLHGAGASTMMPFIASWMSTGPGEDDDSSVVLFLDTMDRTIIQYAIELGILGRHQFVGSKKDMKTQTQALGRKIYSIDDLGDDFEGLSVISSPLSIWLNSKNDLASITSFGPREIIKDMYLVGPDDYHSLSEGGARVFLKTNNTETAGLGVTICNSFDEFQRNLDEIRENQARFSLNRELVIQRELFGQNRSFNLFIDPKTPDEIQVVAVTDQLMEADGKTYRGSVNYPITAQSLKGIGPAIMDMVERIWKRYPEAFGYLMCDFFQSPAGEITIYDPGIRPSGNTATAMVNLLATKLTGRQNFVSNFFLDTAVPGLNFATLCKKLEGLTDPQTLIKTGQGIFPWGWNAIGGKGLLIGVAPRQEDFDEMVAKVRAGCYI